MSQFDINEYIQSIPLPPTKDNHQYITEVFNSNDARIAGNLKDFLSMPGKHLAMFCTERHLDYAEFLHMSKQIGGGNHANT
jgi:hypothetical protein